MPQLTETEINIRRQTLEKDLETVKDGLNKIDAERINLVAPVSYTHLTLPTTPYV